MRFILIDRVLELVPGESARGYKCVTMSEDYFVDHFPGYAVLPGVFLLEGMAQLGGLLAEVSAVGVLKKLAIENGAEWDASSGVRRAILAQVDKAKFEKMVVPGDRIEYSVRLEQSFEGAARVSAEASVDGARVAKGSLTFAMREIPLAQVHRERRALYEQWVRAMDPKPELP